MHPRVLSGLALILYPFACANAATFCVHDSVGFQEALDGAAIDTERGCRVDLVATEAA